jgi:NAD(P)H-hydrate repair Nnr-like enzyme with NAD(P)H-hydrate epimerase domain
MAEREKSSDISPELLMEQAGLGVAQVVRQMLDERGWRVATLLCGPGNNGGDAYLAGTHLLAWGYQVAAIVVAEPATPLCRQMAERFHKEGGEPTTEYFPHSIGVDGLFGIGFHPPAKET